MVRVQGGSADDRESRPGQDDPVTRPTNRRDEVPAHQLDTMRRMTEMVMQRLSAAELAKARIGRYLVLEEIGRGGMGKVFAAYDERLDRKVAVKVLLDDDLGTEQQRLRFLREAQALARLSHPNVVTIHEVGEDDRHFFLAMEFVRGQNLVTWLKTKPPWREVLEVFVQAGRGLAAAHGAGLVHRDLKPANIVRSDDGAVKVLDFGLARAGAEPDSEDLSASSSTLSMRMTRTGVVMGTPAYMAPEQLKGDGGSARSDQYSFCLALWEGLTGARPFEGSTFSELRDARLVDSLQWPSSAPPVPRTIIAALVRGLSVEPEGRWPSMEALLTALAWDPERRRARRWLAATTVGVVGLGGVLARDWMVARDQLCSGTTQMLAGVWDEARRAEVRSAIEDEERPYTRDVWSSTDETLSAYADAWAATRAEACEATTVRGEQSPHLLDLRMRCLDRAAVELKEVVDVLGDAGDEVALRVHRILEGLPPLPRCSDADALEAEVEPPRPSEAQAVEEARRLLARSESLREATRYDEAQAALRSATELLEGIEYGPVRTELAWQRANWLRSVGDFEEAQQTYAEAAELAMKWQQRSLLASTMRVSIHVVSYRLGQPEQALMLWPLLRGVSGDDPVERARDLATVGSVLILQRKLDEAIAMHDEAVSLLEMTPDGPRKFMAGAHLLLGAALYEARRYREAEANLRAALDGSIEVFGPAHPTVGSVRTNLALVLMGQTKYEEAQQQALEAVSTQVAGLPPGHPNIAAARQNYAATLKSGGRYEEAEQILRELLSSASPEDALGPEVSMMVQQRINLAAVLLEKGPPNQALPVAEQAWSEAQGDEIPPNMPAHAAFVLARILWDARGEARDRVRARELGELARDGYRALGEPFAKSTEEVQDWLDEHPMPM